MLYSIPGSLFLDPSAIATGGTAIIGLDERRTEFEDGRGVRLFKRDFKEDSHVALAARRGPALLKLRPLDISATSRKLIFPLSTSSGAALYSIGGTATRDFKRAPRFGLVVRPLDTAELYLYGPAWQMHDTSKGALVFHPRELIFEGSELVLMATRSSDLTKAAFGHDTAANLQTAFF